MAFLQFRHKAATRLPRQFELQRCSEKVYVSH